MEDKKKILIVDDDQNVRTAIQDILEQEGFGISVASNGNEGLKQVESGTFHLILSDVIMPDMDGIEFLRKMRKVNKHVPVIIISGNKLGVQFFKGAQMLGAKSCLLKPFSRTEILNAIEDVFSRE